MKKTEEIHLRVSPAEDSVFRQIAARYGMSVAAWIRLSCRKAIETDAPELARFLKLDVPPVSR